MFNLLLQAQKKCEPTFAYSDSGLSTACKENMKSRSHLRGGVYRGIYTLSLRSLRFGFPSLQCELSRFTIKEKAERFLKCYAATCATVQN